MKNRQSVYNTYEWNIGFQDPASPIGEGIIRIHHELILRLVFVCGFVFWIRIRILIKFIKNKKSIRVVESIKLEIRWTRLPCRSLLILSLPSLGLRYSIEELYEPTISVKVVGHQWYWTYTYSDYYDGKDIDREFESYILPDEEREEGQYRLLEVDNPLVLPINTHVRIILTSGDVLHSWAVPSLGIKMDACPGRLNQVSLYMTRPGTFYGQCSELCGVNHGFIPIRVDSLKYEEFIKWREKNIG